MTFNTRAEAERALEGLDGSFVPFAGGSMGRLVARWAHPRASARQASARKPPSDTLLEQLDFLIESLVSVIFLSGLIS